MKKRIKGYENYSISDNGIVTNENTGKTIKPCNNGRDYLYVKLGSKSPHFYVHRLVAEHFIPNIYNYNEIDHINGIKSDNSIDNLRWCSHKQNMNNPVTRIKLLESIKNIRRKPRKVKGINCKKTKGISLTDNNIVYFNSIVEAANFVGCSPCQISNNIHGRIPHAKGYVWQFQF